MDMFTSYGHIKKTKKNHRFFYDFSLIESLLKTEIKVYPLFKFYCQLGSVGLCVTCACPRGWGRLGLDIACLYDCLSIQMGCVRDRITWRSPPILHHHCQSRFPTYLGQNTHSHGAKRPLSILGILSTMRCLKCFLAIAYIYIGL